MSRRIQSPATAVPTVFRDPIVRFRTNLRVHDLPTRNRLMLPTIAFSPPSAIESDDRFASYLQTRNTA